MIKHPSALEVECDICGEIVWLPTAKKKYVGDLPMFSISESVLGEAGWTWYEDETYCPECSKEESEDIPMYI